MRRIFTVMVVVLGLVTQVGWTQPQGGVSAGVPEEMVSIQLPNSTVQEVVDLYERLTGKRLIRDSNLSGPNLSISSPVEVPKSEAIALIEAALLLNLYQIVPVDENTVKVLGPTKQARSESVQLFTSPLQLPETDQVVSYFMPFRFIKNEEAKAIFESYVQVRQFGSIVPVPNVNALVITENVPLVRRLVALKQVIDVEGARTVTEFFTLTRADAERVAEILTEMFKPDDQAGPSAALQQAQRAQQQIQQAAQEQGGPAVPDAGGLVSALPSKVQVLADTRTNRVIVQAPEGQMAFIRELVSNLDEPVEFEEPLQWPLRFANAGEVLPVLANLLAENEEDAQAAATSTETTQNAEGDFANSGGGGGGGTGGGVPSKPDLLREPAESTAPQSIIVGKSRIIADRSANTIIVIGPPESRSKAASVLSMLDQRPRQIYLAVVIGQLTLGDGLEFGIDYLMRFGDVRILGQGQTAGITNLLRNRTAAVDILPDTDDVVDVATDVAANALPVLSGLTVFGTIADSVDIFARALGTTNRFEVISRPVVYTVNNKKAVISSGQQVPVPTSSLTSVVDNTVNNLGTSVQSNIEFKDVVLKLEVIPLVNSDDEVTLKIAQQNDNVQGTTEISGNQIPIIATQELRTTVTVPNKHTVILGGLITDEESLAETGIPLLKDIPYLGYLFGSTTKEVNRRELIVMIQPFIINEDWDVAKVNAIERGEMSFDEAMVDPLIPPTIRKAQLPGVTRYDNIYLEPAPQIVE